VAIDFAPRYKLDPTVSDKEQPMTNVRAAWAELPDTEARMKRVKVLLEKLVNDQAVQEHSKSWPSTEGHKNLLLYEDPDHGFVVNAVVRTPGRDGRIHDHAHAWTAYGVLDGTELLERYRRVDAGKRENYALLQLESLTEGYRGKVDLVAPYAIHSEKGGPTRSVAVIVRSERLVGKTLQGRYDAKTDAYHQSQGPIQVPFEIV
jgi:predicted metal-dependent enzyme (double-stranded beta helix superfamily)